MKYWIVFTYLFIITMHSQAAEHQKHGRIVLPYATKEITLENQTNHAFSISFFIPNHGFGGPHKKRRSTITLLSQTTCTIQPVLERLSKDRLLDVALLAATPQEQRAKIRLACKPTESHLTFVTTKDGHGISIQPVKMQPPSAP